MVFRTIQNYKTRTISLWDMCQTSKRNQCPVPFTHSQHTPSHHTLQQTFLKLVNIFTIEGNSCDSSDRSHLISYYCYIPTLHAIRRTEHIEVLGQSVKKHMN